MDVIATLRSHEGLLNVRKLKALLGKDRQTLYRWCWSGKLPHLRVGGRLMFDGNRIADWLQARSL